MRSVTKATTLALLLMSLTGIPSYNASASPTTASPEQWLSWADVAWRFFQPGVGVDSQTGLGYAGYQYPFFTMWDAGTYLFSLVDADKIGLVKRSGNWGLDYRIDRVLSFLESMPLTSNNLPFVWYSARDGKSAFSEDSTNVWDLGQLLIALHTLRSHRPEYYARVQNIVNRINLGYYASNEDSIGVSLSDWYISHGFSFFGFASSPLVRKGFSLPESMRNNPQVETYGVTLPTVYITSEQAYLAAFYLTPSDYMLEVIQKVSLVQERRYQATSKYTAWSEGNTDLSTPSYVYEWIVTSSADKWLIDGNIPAPINYIKAAFAMHALTGSDYSLNMIQHIDGYYPNHNYGYYDGVDENGRLVKTLIDRTNGFVIASARYALEHQTKAPVGLRLELSPSKLSFGSSVTVKAVVSRPVYDSQIALEYRLAGGTWTSLATMTPFDGAVEYKWTPAVGLYEVRARWLGNSFFLAVTGPAQSLEVTKLPSTTTLAVDRNMVKFGEELRLSGRITPAAPSSTVQIMYSRDGASWSLLRSLSTDLNGAFQAGWKPSATGRYYFRASWSGNANYDGSSSPNVELRVEKASSSARLSITPTSIIYGGNIDLMLEITPNVSTGSVSIVYSSDLNKWFEVASGSPQNGLFKARWSPTVTGTLHFRGSWSGDENYLGSNTELSTIKVDKAQSITSITLSRQTARYGEDISMLVEVKPQRDSGQVTIFHSDNGGEWTAIHTSRLTSGHLSYTWTASSTGRHLFKASWTGDEYYQSSTSPTVELKVEKTPSQIEMTVQLQQITYGETITITLKIKPATPTGLVSIRYDAGDGVWRELLTRNAGSGLIETPWRPTSAGKYQIKATWSGDDKTLPSETPSLLLEVLKAPSVTTLRINPTNISYGENIIIQSAITPKLSTGTIVIQLSTGEDESNNLLEGQPSDGGLRAQWMPPKAASFKVRAVWSGDQNHVASFSEPVSVTVSKAASTVSITVEKEAVVYGEAVKIELKVFPSISTGAARILYSADDGSTWKELFSEVPLKGSLVFEKSFEAGSYKIHGDWNGNDFYKPSESQVRQLTVHKLRPSILLNAPAKIAVNETIQISGFFTPTKTAVKLSLVIESPSILLKKQMVTDSEGRFIETFLAAEAGISNITVRWEGTSNIEGSEAKATVQVLKPDSVIQDKTSQPEKPPILSQNLIFLAGSAAALVAIVLVVVLKWKPKIDLAKS